MIEAARERQWPVLQAITQLILANVDDEAIEKALAPADPDDRVAFEDPEAEARSEFLWRLMLPFAPRWRVERHEAELGPTAEPPIEGLDPRAAAAIVRLMRSGGLPEGVRQPLYRIYGGIEETARAYEPLD